MANEGDEATEEILLNIGAQLLDISPDTMLERIYVESEDAVPGEDKDFSLGNNCEIGIYDCDTCPDNGCCTRQDD